MASQGHPYGVPPSSTPAPIQILSNDRAYRASGRRNQYFVPGEGIRREVITADICKYLDNDATVRPGTYQGREGYMLYAYRNLTSAMLEDIRRDSAGWGAEQRESQRNTHRRNHAAAPRDRELVQEYERSRTYQHRHNEAGTPSPVTDYPPGRAAPPPDFRHNSPYTTESQYTVQSASTARAPSYAGSYTALPENAQPPRTMPTQQYEYQPYQQDPRAPPYGYPPQGAPQLQGGGGYPAQQPMPQRDPHEYYGDQRTDTRIDPRADPRQYSNRVDPRQVPDPRTYQQDNRGYRR